MPYIAPDQRDALDPSLNWLIRDLVSDGFTVGQLNYIYSRLANAFIKEHGLSYTHCNEVCGVFSAASMEFARRVIAGYEDQKIAESGDVYDCLDPPHEPLTDEQVDALMITDGHGQYWMRCYDGDCALVVVGVGKVECDNCDQKIDSDYQPERKHDITE